VLNRLPSVVLLRTLRCCSAIAVAISFCTSSWAQRDLKDIPTPDPVAEQAAMKIADGFEVNLFASDPMFAKPVHMNFDEQGRLWVASSKNYPQLQPGAQPTDQIVILEDTDGDGKADKHTVFADNLMIPTGVLPGDGGVYVANSIELIHLSDTDGDGKADKRRTVLSGFGTEDTHHLLHTLRWCPDGRMAMAQSIYIHSHIETPYGVKHLDGGGIWKFDVGRSQLEIFCKGFVNPWGHAIDAYGQSFATDGAYGEGVNYVFPRSVFVTSPGAERWLKGMNPGSPKHCGLEIVTGTAMPEDAQGWMITNDFRGHRVCVFKIERQGAGYRGAQLPELIRTEHIAFRPIDVKMGGDGAIYIADWYNPIIQHGEVDFRDPRRDTEHGRIWRVTAKGMPAAKRPDYASLSEAELVKLLDSRSLSERQFARNTLRGRSVAAVDAALNAWMAAAPESEERVLESVWVRLGQHRLDKVLLGRLRLAEDARIRAAGLRMVGEHASEIAESLEWLKAATKDVDDQVVLEAICGLHSIGSLSAVESVLTVTSRPNQDQNLEFAIWNALRETEPIWLKALRDGELDVATNPAALQALADATKSPDLAALLIKSLQQNPPQDPAKLIELIALRSDVPTLSQLVQWMLTGERVDRQELASWLNRLVEISRSRKLVPENIAPALTAAMEHVTVSGTEAKSLATRTALANAASAWKVEGAIPILIQWLRSLSADADVGLPESILGALAGYDIPEARQVVRELANSSGGPNEILQPLAVVALASFDPAAATQKTLSLFASDSDAHVTAGQAVVAILNRKDGPELMKKAVLGMNNRNWHPDQARALLSAVRGASQAPDDLISAIVSATGLENAGWQWSDEFAARMIQLASQSGDAVRGEAIYRQRRLQCMNCHAIGESGVTIGPNLLSVGGSATPDYILQSLVDPAAKVKEGFQTLTVLLDDDSVVIGLQKSKTNEILQLVLADGTTRSIPISSIEEVREGKSLMPAGLVDSLSQQQLADLLHFLSQLGRTPEYTVTTQPWVRNWQTLQWSKEANQTLNRTSLDSAALDRPEMVWGLLPTQVNGLAPLVEAQVYQPHANMPRTVLLRCTIDVKQAGNVMFRFNQPLEAVSTWIDTRPTPTPGPDQPVFLATGKHRLVVGVQIDKTNGQFGLQVLPSATNPAAVEISAQ
jgi:putative heme-binding domain-containing protein